jgi:hypothetical protein
VTLGLPTDDEVALIQCRNEHGAEVDRPETVVGFLTTDVLIGERVGDVPRLCGKRNALP